jgi:putative endonuclease
MFYVYIIQSKKNTSFYIGYTSDILKRIEQHNTGKSRYTMTGIPWELVYIEEFKIKREAIIGERFLKQQKNKEFYLKLIQSK